MERHVVTSFLAKEGLFLLLKRSMRVSSYKGMWAGVSGSIEEGESVMQAALREVREETGIGAGSLNVSCIGDTMRIPYTEFDWVVHPVLFVSATFSVSLNWENDSFRWLKREEMDELETVPGLIDALDNILSKS
ncbi:MAG: NUDIX pyrophosphatase [Candidatus Methanofastidiosa archaeon]|nr:NUDIX pyrophosphatase [Candidatus Methanofastidiosa archaeon]